MCIPFLEITVSPTAGRMSLRLLQNFVDRRLWPGPGKWMGGGVLCSGPRGSLVHETRHTPPGSFNSVLFL